MNCEIKEVCLLNTVINIRPSNSINIFNGALEQYNSVNTVQSKYNQVTEMINRGSVLRIYYTTFATYLHTYLGTVRS